MPLSRRLQPPLTPSTPLTSRDVDRQEARRLLNFLHRHMLRPATGQPRWSKAGRFPSVDLALREPSGVAAAEDGQVLIVDRRARLLVRSSASGDQIERMELENLGRPGWSGGVPFVVTDKRLLLPFDGQRLEFLENRPGKEIVLDGLQVAELSPFGAWYLVAKGWKSLLFYTSRRQGKELLTKSQPQLDDLAVDARGHLYALDGKAKTVSRLDLDQRWGGVALSDAHWRKPVALAIDRRGNFYVLDRGQRAVELYDAGGTLLDRIGPSLGGGIELRNPTDVAVDGSGRLFIADAKLPFIVVME